ncbi:hypothetical protein [Absidia glauca]|uniref:Rab-GAP TBC domain-containing protein n=1 Tax=Absidia glauca TaxID=4829 RepID=A0A168RWL0_ABSGL|nr:hypothetical protein [Absidia glauca]
MDDNTTGTIRKSFWRRNGIKLPGSVRIVPSSGPSVHGEGGGIAIEPHLDSEVLDARYSYMSLVIKNRPTASLSHDSPSTPPLPITEPTTGKSPALPSVAISNSNHQHTKSIDSLASSSSPPPPPSHLRKKSTTATTPHKKTFNAFLEDTNEEWNDSIEDNGPRDDTTDGTYTTTTTTTHTTSSLVPELEEDRIITKLTLTDRPPSPQKPTTTTAPLIPSDVNGVIGNVMDLLKDPTFILRQVKPDENAQDYLRIKKMKDILCSPNVDLGKQIAKEGRQVTKPPSFRLITWQLLLGYLPCNSDRRVETLARKRKEYLDSVKATYARGTDGLDQTLWHQIHIDILRTNPGVVLYQSSLTQECLERILYQWAIRHPASGYVQGINDLVTPIFEVFLSAYIDAKPEAYDMTKLNQDVLDVVEADSFWCLSKLLDGIQVQP